jgi:hypothetical protein
MYVGCLSVAVADDAVNKWFAVIRVFVAHNYQLEPRGASP